MAKKQSQLQIAQQKATAAAKLTNDKIEELGRCTGYLFSALNMIQSQFDRISNVPDENRLKYEELKVIRVGWKQQAEKIELEYRSAEIKAAGQGAAGVGVGVSVAALGPSVAMGVATTFGVASTGTPIATLSGAALTKAALAWLGGGALSTGGGGVALGSAFLALAGPVGLTIAGLSAIASCLMFFKRKHDKERLSRIYTLISDRDVRSYELAIVELSERIERIENESRRLNNAIARVETFGTDYSSMTEHQQYELGAYVNLMEASTMLLVDPILGLRPKFTDQDFFALCDLEENDYALYYANHKRFVVSMANLLYKITLDSRDRKLLAKSLKNNKDFLASVDMCKKDISAEDIAMVERALEHRQSC